ncbi:2-polyprenyl-6-methoxyphenol hydroxylase-like FAD-dependent oxidoreductase [Amycolatopsis bartoniae]|uniref:FAD-dependent oxidoreductase n=1 Tax=Amycolatopsis bartoniae TaxID=941986 RepID=A0A8H9IP81_9PSEU|nr:NAD(P)/FAD-dependent oxidoreductase [Amycolatopsis bartoniae]MBB2938279.1 2-polyprenyl-6-methoxyphenol hydroxylase-like FAD-dependent oxidoreductase [Amycolatopsis bartoniae]GHF33987.1 FAD-dependent oxidoreductase [Amycolatopsis bartoniae]
MPAPGTVLIIGSGLGGLTLAQSLRAGGIDVAVFERDRSPWERPQGYRLHLDADAVNAVREVLPPHLVALFEATSYFTEPFTTILDTDLTVARRLPAAGDVHANVDRATLRRILLTGLDDVLHFGKRLERYESTSAGVTAYFGDGSTAHGDVLVGADGIRSAVRARRAPHLSTVDAGITAIYGRLPLDVARPRVPAEVLDDIFAIASDHRKVFLGLGSVLFPSRHEQDDYVVCVVGGRHEFFPGTAGRSGNDLRELAARALADWPGGAADLVRQGDPGTFFPVRMDTSVPGTLDAPTNVTLLGDAVHAMTPTLGRGANLAMRDAALLGRALRTVAAGDSDLDEALSRYERDMTAYGFRVVREAARIGEQRMAQNPLPAAALQ